MNTVFFEVVLSTKFFMKFVKIRAVSVCEACVLFFLLNMQLLDGKIASAAIYEKLREQVAQLKERGITPGLGTILVGDDSASATYIGAKHRACEDIGVASIHRQLPADISQDELHEEIENFNNDAAIDAYIIQLPLPKGLNEEAALLAMSPDKDADGLHPVNLGRLVMGASGPIPCTPAGIVELLVHYDVPIEGRHVVVVGRGLNYWSPARFAFGFKTPALQCGGDSCSYRREEFG